MWPPVRRAPCCDCGTRACMRICDGFGRDSDPSKHAVHMTAPPKSKFIMLFERDQGRCVYCGLGLRAAHDRFMMATEDHLVPGSNGRKNRDLTNLILSCRVCNGLKANFVPAGIDAVKDRRKYIAAVRLHHDQARRAPDGVHAGYSSGTSGLSVARLQRGVTLALNAAPASTVSRYTAITSRGVCFCRKKYAPNQASAPAREYAAPEEIDSPLKSPLEDHLRQAGSLVGAC